MNIKEVHEYVHKNISHFLTKLMTLVLVVATCLGERSGINRPSAFLKILKLPE